MTSHELDLNGDQKMLIVEHRCVVNHWSEAQPVDLIWYNLERPNWAPWLAASEETIALRGKVFPEGQLVLNTPKGNALAILSLNQINWDGDIHHLPTWDGVAGEPTDYSATYTPNGNTLVLLSMDVSPEFQGYKIPSKLIKGAQDLAQKLGVEHVIGSFRPSGFGAIKKGTGYGIDFETYCMMKRANSEKPIDRWLGSLWHMGMKMLAVDENAMTVSVSNDQFMKYLSEYKPEVWEFIPPNIWECGEVGHWVDDKDHGIVTYTESNVWGELPLK